MTNGSSSRKDPRSRRSSMRSCAVSLPSACWRSIRSAPPPSRRFSRRASRSWILFSSVIRPGERPASEHDPALFGKLPPDAAEQLVAVDASGGDLLARALHHAARLVVQGPLLFRLARESG